MNQLSAQPIQTEAEQHHLNWQQASEGVVIAHHTGNITQYGSTGLTRNGGFKPDENTVFEIGSITKVFTSLLLAEAVRENRAALADPVSRHLTALKFKKDSPFHSITLSELATHTSGLPRLPGDLSIGADRDNPYAHYDEQRLIQSLISFRKNQLHEPGEYGYSNYGAGILGYVLTQIYGQTYRDLLKQKILDPLKMNSTDAPTRFSDLSEDMRARIATPHSAGRAVSHWELSAMVGAGGMISSAEDLIRFGTAHWNNETLHGLAGSLIEVAKLRKPGQGLGWAIEGGILIHGGGTGGFRTNLEVDPKNRTVRVFLSNSASTSGQVRIEGDFLSIQGYWSGVLNTEKKNLRLVSYISQNGRMVLYSIDQGYQSFLSAKSSMVNDRFDFSFPVIEGIYSGRFDNGELVGAITQGGGHARPLTLTYSKDIPDILRKGLDETLSGELKKLAGYWSGYLGSKEELFVYIKITTIGELSILELYSPDQHDRAITINSASLKSGRFEFRSDRIDGIFSGDFATDRKSISGFWKQGGKRTALTLSLSEEKPIRK